MPYEKILKYIDDEIYRLQQARDILAGLSATGERTRKRTPFKRNSPSGVEIQTPASTASAQPDVEIQRLPYKSKARSRRTPHPPESTSVRPPALSGRVPSGPVAVSADEARIARQREQEAKRNNESAPDEEDRSEKSLGSLIRAMMSREAVRDVKTA